MKGCPRHTSTTRCTHSLHSCRTNWMVSRRRYIKTTGFLLSQYGYSTSLSHRDKPLASPVATRRMEGLGRGESQGSLQLVTAHPRSILSLSHTQVDVSDTKGCSCCVLQQQHQQRVAGRVTPGGGAVLVLATPLPYPPLAPVSRQQAAHTHSLTPHTGALTHLPTTSSARQATAGR